jgi:[ribosomal protein S5]-alanine N-acetyltransferase
MHEDDQELDGPNNSGHIYAREAQRIRDALGLRARRIEHVGASAVPGLGGGPPVEIALVVDDPADAGALAPAPGVRLHVFTPRAPEMTRMIRLRDLLRADPAARARRAAPETLARALAPVIRPVEPADAPALAALYSANREFLRPFEPRRPDAFFTVAGQQERARAEAANAQSGRRYAHVILDGDDVAGAIAIDNVVRGAGQMASIGYFVDQARGGRGLATLAVAAAVDKAFVSLDLHRVQAGTLLDNRASQRVLEKNGFERIGIARRYLNIADRWQDHVLFERLAA